jgi:hypothetical protein
VWFAVPYSDVENVTFLLKAGVGGGLPRNVYLYINNKSTGALELAATQAYSAARNEVHTFDLTKFLPDFYGKYNITVRADMGAPTVVFDLQYAYLNVTPFENVSYYKPTKITVRTWNRNG